MSELALGKGAREIADALCEMAEDYGLSIRFQMGGKHPYAEFSKDGRSRKV